MSGSRAGPSELIGAIGGWAWFCATAGGLGHLRPASGTWGSLPPAALLLGMGWLGAPLGAHLAAQSLLCAMASAGCLHHGGKVETATGRKDPGVVVIDEVAGMALTFVGMLLTALMVREVAAASAMPVRMAATVAVAGFVWFRVMDVIKPPPARGLQRVPGGAGVLVDDLVVAPYAAAAAIVSIELWTHLQATAG